MSAFVRNLPGRLMEVKTGQRAEGIIRPPPMRPIDIGLPTCRFQFHQLNHRFGLDIHRIFAGTSAEDFKSYRPSDDLYDALGYDLYVTPENKEQVLRQIQDLRRRCPWKPIVIPEFQIPPAGPGANPRWAIDALGDILMQLGRHPAGLAPGRHGFQRGCGRAHLSPAMELGLDPDDV